MPSALPVLIGAKWDLSSASLWVASLAFVLGQNQTPSEYVFFDRRFSMRCTCFGRLHSLREIQKLDTPLALQVCEMPRVPWMSTEDVPKEVGSLQTATVFILFFSFSRGRAWAPDLDNYSHVVARPWTSLPNKFEAPVPYAHALRKAYWPWDSRS